MITYNNLKYNLGLQNENIGEALSGDRIENSVYSIKAKVNRSIKSPIVMIPLTFHHSMSITPVDKGIQGFAEWFTFMPNSPSPNEYPEFTSRVYVQVFDDLIENKLIESFTIQAPNLEMILRASLSIFHSISGKKLAPIITG